MNADAVIESYVRDVASYLPLGKRNDVAFELRALLTDELAARAEAEGRPPDRAMAMALLRGFGRPAEVARRYHEWPAVIDPADTPRFVVWALGGAVALGVLSLASPTGVVDGDLFLRWLGALVIIFALIGWWRRRNPNALGWTPKREPDSLPRGLAVFSMAATLAFPLLMYAAPQTFVRITFLGALPNGGLALTEAFRDSWQRAATIVVLGVVVAVWAAVAAEGRWRFWTRWTSIVAYACLGQLLIIQAAPMAAPSSRATFLVFESPAANVVAQPIFGLVGALTLLSALYEAYGEWARVRPAPALKKGRAS